MPYVNTKEMLLKAQAEHYAVGAFNVENMEMAQAAISAAEELRSPIILQTTPSTLKYANPSLFRAMIEDLAKDVTIPVAMHLDHGNTIELVEKSIAGGYSSIMIDGSPKSFEDNIAITKEVVAMKGDRTVEAELGKVGGKEDDLDVKDGNYTDPLQAQEFAIRTGIDSLAVAIGTAHGLYKENPVLDKNRLAEIKKLVDIPLVLHGASGLLAQDMRDCVDIGIAKINFATELRIAYTKGVKAYLENDPDVFDPKKYGTKGREYVKNLVMQKIMICGCNGKY